MKRLVAIRTPQIELESRFVAFVDPTLGDAPENIYHSTNIRIRNSYRFAGELYSFAMKNGKIVRGGRFLDHALFIKEDSITYENADVFEKPDLEMYFLASIALKNSGMKFNKKKGEMIYVKNKSNSR
jgi:hypothetical protein